MVRLYIPEPLSALPLTHWFTSLSDNVNWKKDLPANFFETDVERVTEAKDAAAIVLQNNFKESLTHEATAYIQQYADLGAQTATPVVVFSLGDFADTVVFDPRVWVVRASIYRDTATAHDISLPGLTEDNAGSGITTHTKRERPLISFCGMGDLPTVRSKVAFYLKNLRFEFFAIGNKNWRARKLGVYWRRAAMRACERSPLVDTHFIVRKTFSGNKKTIELDPKQARKEYLESITESDFVIAPKGDGNFSNRFFKTLCLGRFPVLTDTNVVLPLEDVIDYSRIVVRVPMSDVDKTPAYVRAFYDALTDVEFRERQREARTVFETYLKQDVFLRYVFSTHLPALVARESDRHAKTI